MKPTPSISAAIRGVKNATEAALIADTQVNFGTGVRKALYFTQGNLKEINKMLALLTKGPATKNKKFPLLALFRDFKEKLGHGDYGFDADFRCKMAVFNLTDPNYSSDQREDLVFTPILRPIVSELLTQFQMSKQFGFPTEDQLKIEKTDCFFYGTTDLSKNVFGDYVDAIEFDITLKLKNNICPQG